MRVVPVGGYLAKISSLVGGGLISILDDDEAKNSDESLETDDKWIILPGTTDKCRKRRRLRTMMMS